MTDETPLVRSVARLTGAAALALVHSAERAAMEQCLQVAVAIVGDAGQELATYCMDGTGPQALGVARKKAYSAIAYRMPTDEFHEQTHERFGADGAAMITAAVEGTMLLGGGEPVVVDGYVVGAVGVSGGRGEQDRAIAGAAISEVVGSSSAPAEGSSAVRAAPRLQ
ncbi:GlcG/HbpS family heme-binding protein [Arthrobacter castelli]|uniref:GlcG/HbpS family heme-binding protein n=1 Tax=Arthrobacter castelli TaxID=271431 RepID=UPI0006891768|nr:heme-binding protein [Arthrobacter castelli]